MYGYGEGPGWWGYLLMTLSVILFWALIIVGIIALFRYARHGGLRASAAPPPRSGPEQLLAERFARGDIDEQEYRLRLEVLRSVDRPAAQS